MNRIDTAEACCNVINHSTDFIDILRYWHKLEFFAVFDLDEVQGRARPAPTDLSFEVLTQAHAHHFLPWFSQQALINAGGLPDKQYNYFLYLLPFDKKALTQLTSQHFPLDGQRYTEIILKETLADEGLTCFAKLRLNDKGIPDWANFALSTLPWAMGKLASNGLDCLDSNAYENDLTHLKSAIQALDMHLQSEQSLLIDDKIIPNALSPKALIFLLQALLKWANFQPEFPFIAKLQLIEVNIPSERKQLPNYSNQQSVETNQEESEPVEENLVDDLEFSILNSFYIKDLEKSINYLANYPHDVLQNYINGQVVENRIDLLHEKNYALLINAMSPTLMNRGRWPQQPNQIMSLLQQFCINTCFQQDDTPIFATNGPPGTGKTTLLQDIIAENIVKRAEKLSLLEKAEYAFSAYKQTVIDDKPYKLAVLNPELTGFEMLVVSSNNTAVENISLELPLKRKLGEKFQDKCQYLTAVACKVAARHTSSKVVPLAEKEKPWGLISAALGNSKNKRLFAERFSFAPDQGEEQKNRKNKKEYLTIWEWRSQYQGASFAQAKELFKQQSKKLDDFLLLLSKAEQLFKQIEHSDFDKLIDEKTKASNRFLVELETCLKQKTHYEKQQQHTVIEKNKIMDSLKEHQLFKPSWFAYLVRNAAYKNYKTLEKSLSQRWQDYQQDILNFDQLIHKSRQLEQQLQEKIDQLHIEITTLSNEKAQLINHYEQLLLTLNNPVLPSKQLCHAAHLAAFWQNETLNNLRSELFIAALNLHEAWLNDVLKTSSFIGNLRAINPILNNKHPLSSQDELIIWQSLFMIVPVISSTFASIASQFKNLNAKTLGWLLIDEAGQAIPQAAVGALWRCKKAIVVGDPRQIEPIMTVPPHLIEGLAKHHFTIDYTHYLPHTSSIQRLADKACLYGTYIHFSGLTEWSGSPLLVHRRCLDPMFSIANQIAYEDKMINARYIDKEHKWSSSWFDVVEEATEKQYVEKQGILALLFFIKCYQDEGKLPQIFIISPFKAVKQRVQKLIKSLDKWQHLLGTDFRLPNIHELAFWCNKNIGTIHTFQGKESKKVLLVLGADNNQQGAVHWAASKPNLLNVALTRATDEIHVIGDYKLWSGKNYFCHMAQALTRVDASGNFRF